jgi:ribonuclease HI
MKLRSTLFVIYAILNGLQLALDLGFRIITLESDSKSALDLILDNDATYHPHDIVLGWIRTFMSQD